ncbi:MAG: DUF421 domain-containing protein [Williamsia sp.]|nr:DUF421 domain-containing protein [Williamsia sp.]
MKKEEIHLGDIKRWLFGQMPPEFMVEVAIRTILIYLILLLVVRLFGKRMAGQITLVELSVMITLGAITAPVMQLPDRGLFFGVVTLTVALLFQRGLNLWAFKSEKVEHATVGKMNLLVKDGTMILGELDKSRITKQQLFALLREKQIQNLGKVKRAYLEACGKLSVFEDKEAKAGLPIFPPGDQEVIGVQQPSPDSMMACNNCGHVQKTSGNHKVCEVCQQQDWCKAYLQKQ